MRRMWADGMRAGYREIAPVLMVSVMTISAIVGLAALAAGAIVLGQPASPPAAQGSAPTTTTAVPATSAASEAAAGQPQPKADPPPRARLLADETVIRLLVKRYVDAREQRDEKGLTELFTRDADQLTSSGEWRRGRDAVVKGSLASSQATGGTRTITVEAVRFPAPGVAIVDGRYEIAGLQGGESRRMWTTFIMTGGAKDGWLIAGIRNMLPAASAAAPATSRAPRP